MKRESPVWTILFIKSIEIMDTFWAERGWNIEIWENIRQRKRRGRGQSFCWNRCILKKQRTATRQKYPEGRRKELQSRGRWWMSRGLYLQTSRQKSWTNLIRRISDFIPHPDILAIQLPGVFVVALFTGFSWLLSGKIRRMDLAVLLSKWIELSEWTEWTV